MINTESVISDELSRGEVEKREMGGVCASKYSYGGGDPDTEDDSGCPGGYLAIEKPMLVAAAADMTSTGSWDSLSLRRVVLAAMSLLF